MAHQHALHNGGLAGARDLQDAHLVRRLAGVSDLVGVAAAVVAGDAVFVPVKLPERGCLVLTGNRFMEVALAPFLPSPPL
ncbi:MAG: hypothetical protein ACR2L2_06460 [Acidobacteriota bacterium]